MQTAQLNYSKLKVKRVSDFLLLVSGWIQTVKIFTANNKI